MNSPRWTLRPCNWPKNEGTITVTGTRWTLPPDDGGSLAWNSFDPFDPLGSTYVPDAAAEVEPDIVVHAERRARPPPPRRPPFLGLGPTVFLTALFWQPHAFDTCGMGDMTPCASQPPGSWPGPAGAEEWGRRNRVNPDEARRRFHAIKQRDHGQPKDDYYVDPRTGNVYDPNGEFVGNLNDRQP